MILSEKIPTVRLNLIDEMMQNKYINNLFGTINLAMAIIYILYLRCQGAFLDDKHISYKYMTIMNH